MKKFFIFAFVLLLIAGGVFLAIRSRANSNNKDFTRVAVEKGTIIEKALAIGKIDPDYEVVVKSQVSGIVDILHKEVGDDVVKGEPLLVVKPEPTPMVLAGAHRELQLATLNKEQADRDLKRIEELLGNNLVAEKNFEDARKNYQETELREMQARERLELMEKGKSKIGGRQVETLIRAPITGTILERLVNVGDRVVPLTSYQPTTELMKLADMENLIFIGTVDEIDVGKLAEGMKAVINIGALPGDTLEGELYFISPKSRTKDNAIVFDIKIRITERGNVQLRAGYSANADLIIKKKENIPRIPERLVHFRNDSVFVKVLAEGDSLEDKLIEVGLSDGLNIEVVEGLVVGDTIIEEPPREIE